METPKRLIKKAIVRLAGFAKNKKTNYMSSSPLAESTAIGMAWNPQDGIRVNPNQQTTSPLKNTSNQLQIMQVQPHIPQNSQSRGLVKRRVTFFENFPNVQLKKRKMEQNQVQTAVTTSSSQPETSSNIQQQQQPTGIFGANTAPAPTTSPAFGSTNSAGSASQNQSYDFGGAAKPSSGCMFGGFNSQSSNYQQSVQQQAPSSGMFNFGSNSTAPTAAPSVFGSSSSQTVNADGPSVFGQSFPSPDAPPAYQFNTSSNSINSSSNQFIGNVSTSSTSAPSNGFNFGGIQSAPVAGGAFNFQQKQPPPSPQPAPGGGLFSIGTSGNNQQRRPMRQATRRMK